MGDQLVPGRYIRAKVAGPQKRRRPYPHMHLFCARIPQHAHNSVRCGAPDNGIIYHNNPFAVHHFPQRVQLHLDTALPALLPRFDKGTAHIGIFHKSLSIRNAGFHGISHGSAISRLRNPHDQIGVHRGIHRQKLPCQNSGAVYAESVHITVRSGKIDILKYTSGMLLFWQAHTPVGLNAPLRRNGDNFPRLHVPDECCADGVQRTGFRCQYIGIVTPADTKRPKTKRIPGADQFPGRHNDQGICAFDFFHGPSHCLFHGFGIQPLPRNMIGNHFRINGGLENSTCIFQFPAQLRRIDQIAVMGKSQGSFHIIQYKRLGIFPGGAAGGRIPHMPDSNIPLQPFQRLRGKSLVQQPHIPHTGNPVGAFRITDRNAAAFLSSVL